MSLIIIPSIDLREGSVVRLQQGDYNRQLNYAVDGQKRDVKEVVREFLRSKGL